MGAVVEGSVSMRSARWLMVLLAVCGGAAPVVRAITVAAAEADEAAATLEQEVRRLIGELAGEERAARVGAERRLLELGPKVLPLLPAPELLPSVSVREAVRRIRVELERVRARESVEASRVTLAGKKSLAEAISEITRQTGNQIDGRSLAVEVQQQAADLDVRARTFWQAVDEVAARFQVRYEFDARARGLKLTPGAGNGRAANEAVGYSGAFRLAALPAERTRRGAEGDKPSGKSSDLLRVMIALMPEPRLRPLFLQVAPKKIAARSGSKTELQPFSPEANLELPLGEGGAPAPIQIDYVIPQNDVSETVSLKGTVTCTTAAASEQIRFRDLAKAAEAGSVNIARRRGGVTVALNRVRAAASAGGKKEMRVRVTVTYDAGGPAFESHQRWILHNEVYLEDVAGKRVPLNGGSETALLGDGGVGLEYRFGDLPDPPPDYTFVYVAPTLIIDVPIAFEIQSIPVRKK